MIFRRFGFVLLFVLGCGAVYAQSGISGLVRSYHFDRSGSGSSNLCDSGVGCPVAGLWFQTAVGATYASDVGAVTFAVGGNPTRISAPVWPTGLTTPGYAWRLDGTADGLSVADAAGVFSSQAAWSVICGIMPRAGFASGDVFASKWNTTGDKRSWRLHTGGTSVVLDISALGTAASITTLTKAAALAANRMSWVTASCDGAGNCSIWVDGLAVATSAVMGDPYEGDAAFAIGLDAEGAGDVPADYFSCAYYDGAITAANHTRMMQRFRGLMDSTASNPVTVTAATMPSLLLCPPTLCDPFLIDMPANSSAIGAVVAGSGGLYGSSALVNKCWRASFLTWAGAPSAPTGWTEVDTSTGDCVASTTTGAHGSESAACSTADADDAVTLTSGCATVVGGTVMYLRAWAKTTSGTGLLDINILEDDSADCGSITTTTAVVNDAIPAATWTKEEGSITLGAGTIRAKVQISLPAAAAQTTNIDAVLFRAGIATDAGCYADTDADASCSTMVQSVPDNGSLISANGSSSIVGTFRSPWAGTDLAAEPTIWISGAAGAANTLRILFGTATDEPYWAIYDSAVAVRTVVPNVANWSANTDYTVKVRRDGLGAMGLWWNAAWNTTTTGAGTGIRSASQALMYMCGHNGTGFDVWTRDLQTFRRFIQ